MLKSYEEQRKERLSDSIAEYLDVDVDDWKMVEDMLECLELELEYYQKVGDRIKMLMSVLKVGRSAAETQKES
jgi:hypothetical protein